MPNFIMAFVLLHAVRYAGAVNGWQGPAVGFFNWLGFVGMVSVGSVTFDQRPRKLMTINGGLQMLT